MAPARALSWFRRTWLWRYRLTIWVVVFTAITVGSLVQSHYAVTEVRREAEIADARDCMSAWDRMEGSRAAIDKAIHGVLALAYAVSSERQITPERRAQIDAAAGPIVANAQAEIPTPACDRDPARQRLAELEGAP